MGDEGDGEGKEGRGIRARDFAKIHEYIHDEMTKRHIFITVSKNSFTGDPNHARLRQIDPQGIILQRRVGRTDGRTGGGGSRS